MRTIVATGWYSASTAAPTFSAVLPVSSSSLSRCGWDGSVSAPGTAGAVVPLPATSSVAEASSSPRRAGHPCGRSRETLGQAPGPAPPRTWTSAVSYQVKRGSLDVQASKALSRIERRTDAHFGFSARLRHSFGSRR